MICSCGGDTGLSRYRRTLATGEKQERRGQKCSVCGRIEWETEWETVVPEQLDFQLGWAGAVEGMNQATDHTESVSPGWSRRAVDMVKAFVVAHPDSDFISPRVRQWAASQGLDPPASEQAWGNVFRLAAKQKIIRPAGYDMYGDSRMHTQSVRKWRAG